MKIKSAKYISKNIEINQEFHFSHPKTKIMVNKIWNTHFTGSPLWNLFSDGSQNIEVSYNKSIKHKMNLHYATHRSLIEPLSSQKQIKLVLIQGFVSFMDKIEKSALRMLKHEAIKDVRSTTGTNFRGIMLLIGDMSIEKFLSKTSTIFHIGQLILRMNGELKWPWSSMTS